MSDSIGARLRQARELRHLTLPQVSETTKLRTHYLQALENDDYSAIPSAAQARGFLRVYAEFLGLDMAELLPAAAPEPAPAVAAAAAPSPAPTSSAPPSFLAALLKRFSRAKKEEAAPEGTQVATGPVSESSAEESVPASSTAQTARRPRPDSPEVKKNALGR